MNYFSFFKRFSIDTYAETYYNKIKKWDSWYRGDVADFHHYNVYLGKGVKRTYDRMTLGMAKKICEDVADLLMNEKVKITIGDKMSDDFVRKVFDASNFASKGNEYQERKAATGTTAYVPYLCNVETDANGTITAADVKINYFDALHIFPTAWANGRIISAIFTIEARNDGKDYALIQHHKLTQNEDGSNQYIITNKVIDSKGNEVDQSVVSHIPEFRNIAPVIETGSDIPQFVIDRLAIVNNATDDSSNPMGIPIFANSLDVLKKIDIEFDSYANEFILGRKRIFVAPEMMKDVDGEFVFDTHDGVYRFLPDGYFENTNDAIHEVDMNLRIEEHEKAINNDLNLLSLKCGLGTQYYKFERGSIATATQVISENSELFRTIKKHELPLSEALEALIRTIIRLGEAAGKEGLDPEAEIRIDFDDSIIQDKDAERKQDRDDVEIGAMSLAEYRAKWYSETLEEAEKKIKANETS